MAVTIRELAKELGVSSATISRALNMEKGVTDGALYEAKRVGLKIPEDLSIVGFGDIPFASLTDPPLTTVRAPYQKLGETLTKLTINLIEGNRLAQKHILLPVEFIERKSTSPAT
jgi:DNA-binding LacI/PurR family transcriptional regulator